MIRKAGKQFKESYRVFLSLGAALVTVFLTYLILQALQSTASAASASSFNPGNIISDEVMGNYNSMSVEEIQRFLTEKGNCNNTNRALYEQLTKQYPNITWHFENGHFICLSEERFGDGQNIGSGQTAAEVIYEAAKDYEINPQVIIVLLEKEQGLITDSYPNSYNYRAATGYGCPDTAACDTKYYGFKNQVRNAAAMFRSVLDGGWSNYPSGRTNYVQYHPNKDCGGTNVYIENRATSALYRYTPYQPNSASLNAGYGTGDICSSYGNRNFYMYFTDWFGSTQEAHINKIDKVDKVKSDFDFSYITHIQNIGWQESQSSGTAAGSVGLSARLEAFNIDLGKYNDQIVYRSHIQNIGWESTWHHGDEISGTTGQEKAVEAVQLQLIGDLAKQYDIYYRVHAANIGWMKWAKNGAPAGTTAETRQLEAIQIIMVKKNANLSLSNGDIDLAYRSTEGDVEHYLFIEYQAHTANIGWMEWVKNGQTAGTTGQSRQMEALNIQVVGDDGNSITMPGVQYRTHIRGKGWSTWLNNGQTAGTTGQSLPIEAIEIKLTGDFANRYNITYRAHVSDIGWMSWAKGGELSGTTDQNHQIEAIEIQLRKK